jgi:predicted dehydrogenase
MTNGIEASRTKYEDFLGRILILGAGSVGKRHAANFASLGYLVDCVDPREDRRHEFLQLANAQKDFPELRTAIAGNREYKGVVVCSPPVFHVEQSILCLDADIPVFLEKPVSPDLSSAVALREKLSHSTVPLLLGYTWRWWPALKFLRKLVQQKQVGKHYFARFTISAHLADWHPWEDYRDFFMSNKKLGGGALLDESHWIDQMLWLFGTPKSVSGIVDRISDLEITSDDFVELIVRYDDKFTVSMHLDLFGRPHEKSIVVIGGKGRISWTEEANCVSWVDNSGVKQEKKFQEERNAMFLDAAKEFANLISGEPAQTCTLNDGIQVLKVVEAIRQSDYLGQTVEVN